MSETPLDEWASILWSHYAVSIGVGGPFYLAASGELLFQLSGQLETSFPDPATAWADFNKRCNALTQRCHTKITFKKEVFQAIPGSKHSRAICLAVQQVLVVEMMLRDSEYSEAAYFPRYRDILGLDDTRTQGTPLKSEDFRRLWDTLAAEIVRVPGGTPQSITFAPGKGPDLNRAIPMSQALLTAQELVLIGEARRRHSTPAERLFELLLRLRTSMNSRARSLIHRASRTPPLRERLRAQVEAFDLATYTTIAKTLRPLSLTGTFSAFLEDADLFSLDAVERFNIRCEFEGSQIPGSDSRATQVLEQKTQKAGWLFLTPTDDGFSEPNGRSAVPELGPVVALVKQDKRRIFEAVCSQYRLSFSLAGSDLADGFVLFVDWNAPARALLATVLHRRDIDEFPPLELVGGLLANARTNTYLLGYPPIGLRRFGESLPKSTCIELDDVPSTLGDLLSMLSTPNATGYFELSYSGSSITFSVLQVRVNDAAGPSFGFPLAGDKLGPSAREMDQDAPGLRGVWFKGIGSTRQVKLSSSDLPFLLSGGKRLAVSQSALARLVSDLSSVPDSPLATIVIQQVSAMKSIPLAAATRAGLREYLGH